MDCAAEWIFPVFPSESRPCELRTHELDSRFVACLHHAEWLLHHLSCVLATVSSKVMKKVITANSLLKAGASAHAQQHFELDRHQRIEIGLLSSIVSLLCWQG